MEYDLIKPKQNWNGKFLNLDFLHLNPAGPWISPVLQQMAHQPMTRFLADPGSALSPHSDQHNLLYRFIAMGQVITFSSLNIMHKTYTRTSTSKTEVWALYQTRVLYFPTPTKLLTSTLDWTLNLTLHPTPKLKLNCDPNLNFDEIRPRAIAARVNDG